MKFVSIVDYLPSPEIAVSGVMALLLVAACWPSYQQASTQSDVALARSEMAVLAIALEAYRVDHGAYPNCHSAGYTSRAQTGSPTLTYLERLSTPIAYVTTSRRNDPFIPTSRRSAATAATINTGPPSAVLNDPNWSFYYQAWNQQQRYTIPPDAFSSSFSPRATTAFLLQSAGPDLSYYNLGGPLANDRLADDCLNLFYDPTNGTTSRGSLFKFGGNSAATVSYAGGTGMIAADAIAQQSIVAPIEDTFVVR